MYAGSPPTGHTDSFARQAVARLDLRMRELEKQVADLQAARDDTPDSAA